MWVLFQLLWPTVISFVFLAVASPKSYTSALKEPGAAGLSCRMLLLHSVLSVPNHKGRAQFQFRCKRPQPPGDELFCPFCPQTRARDLVHFTCQYRCYYRQLVGNTGHQNMTQILPLFQKVNTPLCLFRSLCETGISRKKTV